jgi:AcrR family transcriptional regulator
MKISSEQKQINRRNIIQATVDISIKKGFKSATMREIARQAGLGDATIYNYFATKEAILFAYYDEHFNRCIERLQGIEKFNTYSLQEQLQVFFETSLELYLPDREFVEASFKTIFFTMSQQYKRLRDVRERFLLISKDMLKAAIEAKEIPDQIFQDVLLQLFWDYYIGIVIYWLADDSDMFTDTSLLIDKSLDIICALLKAGIANKLFDMGTYLFKNHVLNRMQFINDRVDTLHYVKREFMGAYNERQHTAK